MTYTVYGAKHWEDKALALAKGTYQTDLLLGYQAWSGSTLKGKAKQYGGKYRASREGLIDRLKAAHIPVAYQTIDRKKVLLIGVES